MRATEVFSAIVVGLVFAALGGAGVFAWLRRALGKDFDAPLLHGPVSNAFFVVTALVVAGAYSLATVEASRQHRNELERLGRDRAESGSFIDGAQWGVSFCSSREVAQDYGGDCTTAYKDFLDEAGYQEYRRQKDDPGR